MRSLGYFFLITVLTSLPSYADWVSDDELENKIMTAGKILYVIHKETRSYDNIETVYDMVYKGDLYRCRINLRSKFIIKDSNGVAQDKYSSPTVTTTCYNSTRNFD